MHLQELDPPIKAHYGRQNISFAIAFFFCSAKASIAVVISEV